MQLEHYSGVDLSVDEPEVKQQHLVQGLLYPVYEHSLPAFFEKQTCKGLHQDYGGRVHPR